MGANATIFWVIIFQFISKSLGLGLTGLDTTADPCQDFYQYACGAGGPFPSLSGFKLGVLDKLRKIFESSRSDLPVYSEVKSLYKSCMDTDNIEKNAMADMLRHINNLGGWPVVLGTRWDGTNSSWYQLSVQAKHLGFRTGMFLSLIHI